MDFKGKLHRLVEGKVQAEIARKAEISPTVLNTYLRRKSVPRADIALRLARALEVPLDWLVDNEQPWPPPQKPTLSGAYTHSELMTEVRERYTADLMRLAELFYELKAIDWPDLIAKLKATRPSEPQPEEIVELHKKLRYFPMHMEHITHLYAVLPECRDERQARMIRELLYDGKQWFDEAESIEQQIASDRELRREYAGNPEKREQIESNWSAV